MKLISPAMEMKDAALIQSAAVAMPLAADWMGAVRYRSAMKRSAQNADQRAARTLFTV